MESFGLRVHLYADDTQLYGFSSPDDSAALADLIRRAIDSVSEWMASNRLLLNGDKTQYIWFGTKQQLGKRDVQRLTDISPALTSTSVVRNLGVPTRLGAHHGEPRHQALPSLFFSNSDGCARCDVRSHRM